MGGGGGGQGSRFLFFGAGSTGRRMNDSHRIEILLVEDDANEIELEMIALRGFHLDDRIYAVRDGVEALDFLRRLRTGNGGVAASNLKLVLLDLKLPKISGFEVLQAIKSDEVLKMIPVVVLTSSAESGDIERSYRTGANSYIIKPMDSVRFMDEVGELCRYWMYNNEPPYPAKILRSKEKSMA